MSFCSSAGTLDRTTPPNPAMQSTPTQRRSTVCHLTPTASSFLPLALQTRWDITFYFTLHCILFTVRFNLHRMVLWSWWGFFLIMWCYFWYSKKSVYLLINLLLSDCCPVGLKKPKTEAAFLWVTQGRDLPGKICHSWHFLIRIAYPFVQICKISLKARVDHTDTIIDLKLSHIPKYINTVISVFKIMLIYNQCCVIKCRPFLPAIMQPHVMT